jgi:glycosyltransferase involved in cell wall biosynthesis
MKICKIWDADYPWDIRVEKVATSLSLAGHSVHLVCRNLGRRVRVEHNGTFTVHRLPALPRALGPLHGIANFPYPMNPVWSRAMARVVRDTGAELILVRDIPLVVPAIVLGRLYRLPVILDLAENYPAMLRDRMLYTATGPVGRVVRHPALAHVIERVGFRFADHIIVVVEESRDRLIRAGVSPDRLSVVCNTPRLEQWTRGAAPGDGGPRSEETKVVYLGNLDGSRGIDVAIRAVHHLKGSGHRVALDVIGGGPSLESLRRMAVDLDVADRVTITGRLPFREVEQRFARADVGLIPHYSTEAWNTTIPNKLFDYMLLGLPVIVSDARPTARIVEETGCGEVFRDRDVADLARCMAALADTNQRKLKGDSGRAAVHGRYNWAHDSKIFVDVVESVGSRAALRSRR